MDMKPVFNFVVVAAALLAGGLVADSWLAARRTSTQLAAATASQGALINRIAAREQEREKQLTAALARIAAEKRRVRTPRQVAASLPSVLPPLPLPVGIRLPNLSMRAPNSQQMTGAPATLSIPQVDLKPLYDALQDCRATTIERDADKQTLADQQARLAALTRERDAALEAAHGGSFWSRLKRGAKWFVIGAAVGAAAYSTSHH